MAEVNLQKLFGALNSLCYRSMEAAAIVAKQLGNPEVTLQHFIKQLMQLQDSDLARLVRHYNLNPSKLLQDVDVSVERLKRGSAGLGGFSTELQNALLQAWIAAGMMFGDRKIRSAHIFFSLLNRASDRKDLLAVSQEFGKIDHEVLLREADKILGDSVEGVLNLREGGQVTGDGAAPGEASGAMAPAGMGKEEAIRRFCKDLTAQAREGKIDQIVGRDDETRQVIDILMRRRQNNPLLTGEAGVGKTAVVEGFAHKIVQGDVPPPLRDVRLLELDLAALQAGASMKGEFENRLKQVIEEVQSSPKPIVMFIDEVHTLMGAGGAAGTGDAAQLLKPALARGTLRTVAATTWSEYKKHIEKDPALTRRFQTVKVDEPDVARAILMMRKVADAFEKHHKVQILDEAIESAVKLSDRYIHGRQLPDKAVSLLDTACARVAVGQHAVPAEVDDTRKRIEALETERGILQRETAVGMDHAARMVEVEGRIREQQERLAQLEANWKREKDLVDQILTIRSKLRGPARIEPVDQTHSREEAQAGQAVKAAVPPESQLSDAERAQLITDLKKLQADLAELQGDHPLILPSCDGQAVAAVVADWTGVPVGRMVKNEVEAVLRLSDTLNKRIIGQRHALDAIAKRIQTSRAGLENPNKPIGVFMLAGTSGVGKTETALALAEALYGDEDNVITINMSEYQEAHKVATLMGPPPGYVGFGSGGILTEAVRRKPYSIVLLDEVEKAHGDIHEVFFQVFDKGVMKDSEGTEINFRNTIILLTTNAGSDLIMNMCKDPELLPDVEALQQALRAPLLKVFPAALLGRLTVIPYYPLTDEMIRLIAKLQLSRIERRIRENHKAEFIIKPEVIDLIASRCTELESGGRMIDNILTQTLLPDLSNEFLKRMIAGGEVRSVSVGVNDSTFAYEFA
ncbi:MAG: type VI secretion system ATPase TssH [Phycisphaeraceae bacterium]|nr:type VI secretion system ATPase TssH [Phycisphaeraceae bacterium]MCW5754179.1 type VI secretion system ATPase TssH [Phycisphaeraceae bacterium]